MGHATHMVVLTKLPAFYNSTFNTLAGGKLVFDYMTSNFIGIEVSHN